MGRIVDENYMPVYNDAIVDEDDWQERDCVECLYSPTCYGAGVDKPACKSFVPRAYNVEMDKEGEFRQAVRDEAWLENVRGSDDDDSEESDTDET